MVCFPRSKQILFGDVIRILFISSGEIVVPPYRRPQRAGHRQTLLPRLVRWLLRGTARGQGASPRHTPVTASAAEAALCLLSSLTTSCCRHCRLTATVQVPPEPPEPSGTRSLSGATLSPALIPLKTNYYQPRQKVNTSNISLSLWTHGNPIHLSLSFNPSQQGTEENTQHRGLPRPGVLVGFPVPLPHPVHPEWILCRGVEGAPGKGTALVTEGCGRTRGVFLAQDKGFLCAPSHSGAEAVVSSHYPAIPHPFPGCSRDQTLAPQNSCWQEQRPKPAGPSRACTSPPDTTAPAAQGWGDGLWAPAGSKLL